MVLDRTLEWAVVVGGWWLGGGGVTDSAITGYERRVVRSLAVGGTALWAIDWTAVRGAR